MSSSHQVLILKRFVTACSAVGQRFVLELCGGLSEVLYEPHLVIFFFFSLNNQGDFFSADMKKEKMVYTVSFFKKWTGM